jgi:hypothetical protein
MRKTVFQEFFKESSLTEAPYTIYEGLFKFSFCIYEDLKTGETNSTWYHFDSTPR